jgi:hypothetical protein
MAKDSLDSEVTIVDPGLDKTAVVILYGGLHGWEGDWFLKKGSIPKKLLDNLIFVLPKHFLVTCKDCFDALSHKVPASRVKAYAICGYSRGAQEVYRNLGFTYPPAMRGWDLIGLIDPSAPTLDVFKDDVVDNYKDKIRCTFWVPNWGKDGYNGRVPRFAQHLRDLKVKMVEKDVAHEDQPAFFFQQFGDEFLRLAS